MFQMCFNPLTPGHFAKKCLLKRVKPFLGRCLAKRIQTVQNVVYKSSTGLAFVPDAKSARFPQFGCVYLIVVLKIGPPLRGKMITEKDRRN